MREVKIKGPRHVMVGGNEEEEVESTNGISTSRAYHHQFTLNLSLFKKSDHMIEKTLSSSPSSTQSKNSKIRSITLII